MTTGKEKTEWRSGAQTNLTTPLMYSFCCNLQMILSEDHREKLVHMKPNKPATKMPDEE